MNLLKDLLANTLRHNSSNGSLKSFHFHPAKLASTKIPLQHPPPRRHPLPMRRPIRIPWATFLIFLGFLTPSTTRAVEAPPEDFPEFTVPGAEDSMAKLRRLHWLHYPGAGPKATLWDEWLSTPGLWPAVDSSGKLETMRAEWRRSLSNRGVDEEGYVATHQHASISHQTGWPFPFWNQGAGGFGWHFSFQNTIGGVWRQQHLTPTNGWSVANATEVGLTPGGWTFTTTGGQAILTSSKQEIDPFQAPFVQVRWSFNASVGLQRAALEWTTADAPGFSHARRMEFETPTDPGATHYLMIPVHRHPEWKGKITQLRLLLPNLKPGAEATLQALFTHYDTRHNINSQNFIRGSANYFWWTGDRLFLRANINRMRLALRHLMTEHHGLAERVIKTTWVGHDGLSGLRLTPDGKKEILPGHGVGNNYWDLLPFGNYDAYATIHYFDTLRTMARLEAEILRHPEWNLPLGVFALTPGDLLAHAEEVRKRGNELFWNAKTGRFVACVDVKGASHDYGFTFLNLEAIHYGFAEPGKVDSILSWIEGRRLVEGDTSTGADIYHWRFGPRSTTRRNIDWYMWAWSGPETIPFGGQVQDGGAVLGFSFHDLSARLRALGPDNAWGRLNQLLNWYGEVEAAGGYRAYYNGTRDGTLQGGGTAGGLGFDHEFFESVLVPQIMLSGFLGFQPGGDGFAIDPKLPKDWPSLAINRIRWHEWTLAISVEKVAAQIQFEGPAADQSLTIHWPGGIAAATHSDPAVVIQSGREPGTITLNPIRPGLLKLSH